MDKTPKQSKSLKKEVIQLFKEAQNKFGISHQWDSIEEDPDMFRLKDSD